MTLCWSLPPFTQSLCGELWWAVVRFYLFLEGLQWFKLQAGQFDLDVFGNIWDEEGQDELEGQQTMLKSHSNKHIAGIKMLESQLFSAFICILYTKVSRTCFEREINITWLCFYGMVSFMGYCAVKSERTEEEKGNVRIRLTASV